MSCDNWTYDTAIIDRARRLDGSMELGNERAESATETLHGKSLKQRHGGPTADRSDAIGHRHSARSQIIPDSTQMEPEYVWGDEGPIND